MRRRDFIALVGGSALALPPTARGQQRAPSVIGFLRNARQSDSTELVEVFQRGLKQAGYAVGENVSIEYRWTDGQQDRVPSMIADLVRHPVAVLVVGGTNETRAARAATASIPIVFANGDDPLKAGHVASLSRPEGNVTGASFFSAAVVASKRLELLHQLVPKVATVAFLENPTGLQAIAERNEVQTSAQGFRLQMLVLDAAREDDFEPAFGTLADRHVGALFVAGDVLFLSRRDHLIALAARYAIPTVYQLREYVTSGGLMSYGASITDTYRIAGIYTGQILKGAKPSDLPVMLPTKYELALNLKTAKALGLDVPPMLLALADEVIE
jgi:putative ABC transport system substrate-binding protein